MQPSERQFPAGWDRERVKRLIEHYEAMPDDAMIAEDEAAQQDDGQTVMVIPSELVPAVRELIAKKSA